MSQLTADQRLADFQDISVIDISDLLHGKQRGQALPNTLGRAARKVGSTASIRKAP